MLRRFVTAALHRTGLVRLRRRSTATSKDERRAAARAEKIKVKAERQAQKDGLRQTAATVEQLSGQLADLARVCRRLERRADGLEQIIVRNRRDAARLAEFRRLAGDGSIARHVEAAIAAAAMFDEPAPMLAIDGLFPDAVYDMFLAAIPQEEAFSVKDRVKADYRARKPQALVPDLTEAMWSYLDEDLIPRTILPAIGRR